MPDEFLAIASIAIFGIPAAAWVAVRMMEHVERMEMIRRGMFPPAYQCTPPSSSLDACMHLGRGVVLAALSMVLVGGLSFVVLTDEILVPGTHSVRGASWWAALPGLAFLAFFAYRRASRRRRLSRPLPPKKIRDAGASLKLL
jgi:membrane associated rhomboid family serine protease